ncbi:MAG: hypothetical protein J6E46_00275 [Faecalicoccus sp.]|nr:hypothetical protein [Faecalicoccus sp.]
MTKIKTTDFDSEIEAQNELSVNLLTEKLDEQLKLGMDDVLAGRVISANEVEGELEKRCGV